MTLDQLLTLWIEAERHLADVAVEFNKANKKRREIEARYMIDGQSKVKAEALFITKHSDDRDNYQAWKEEVIKAESREKQLSKSYYQARDGQNKGDSIDSQISQLVKDM